LSEGGRRFHGDPKRRLEVKDKVRGKTEEIKGKVTGDKGLQLKGKARQKLGRVKESAKAIAYDVEHSRGQKKP
jgi:uncharacterized protein YjbJ (UPF0337 family)